MLRTLCCVLASVLSVPVPPADAQSSQGTGIAFTELMYHPRDPSGAELAAGLTTTSDFEYLKLEATETVVLRQGTALSDGVSYTFEAAFTLESGSFLVIADNLDAFEARYGEASPSNFLCCFSGKLSNSGEAVVLSDPRGAELARVEYTDDDRATDGGGAALGLLPAGGWHAVLPAPHCRWADEWAGSFADSQNEAPASVVISEINYKPANTLANEWRDSNRGGTCRTDFVYKRGGDNDEYVELHNPTADDIDLRSWQLAGGVSYSFPADPSSVIPAGSFLLLCRRDPLADSTATDTDADPRLCCQHPQMLTTSCCHRYSGELSNSGEQLYLLNADAEIVEQVEYDAERPWPEAADGYGRSLERISVDAAAANPDSWLASSTLGGTPGAPNSNSAYAVQQAGAPAGLYVRHTPDVSPSQPMANTPTTITVEIEGIRAGSIAAVSLLWELTPQHGQPSAASTEVMTAVQGDDSDSPGLYTATVVPAGCAGNCMLRWTLRVSVDGEDSVVALPSPLDPLPCWSVFVADVSEPPPLAGGHRLIVWGYPTPQRTNLLPAGPQRTLSGVVIWAPGEAEAETFDGSTVELTKKNNLEIEFVKSNRWEGRDQLKVAFEAGVNGQGGELGPIVEHWGYWIFANQPHTELSSEPVTPWNAFTRVDIGGSEQQALMLGVYDSARMHDEMGRGKDGDVWKRGFYNGYFTYKVTNFGERVLDLQKMIERLRTVTIGSPLNDLVETAGVRVGSWLSFLSGCLLISNWDGYMNNHFLHQDANGDGLWDINPWDFDKTSGLQDPGSYASRQDIDMPGAMGLDGHAPLNARPPNSDGIATINKSLLHHCEFAAAFRELMPLTAAWLGSDEVAQALDAHEAAMLAQIEVMEAATGGIPRTARRRAIAQAHTGLRSYNRQRSAFLLTSQAGVQCTLAWCDGGSSPTTTLLTQATATTTISTSGGVGSCVWSSAANAPAPPPTGRRRRGYGGSRANTDCTRPGGLAAVGTLAGSQVCSCCSTDDPAAGGSPPGFGVAIAGAAGAVCATEPASGGEDPPLPGDTGTAAAPAVGCGAEDVNADNSVSVADLLLVLGGYGMEECCAGAAAAELCGMVDVNDDCDVTVADLLLVLGMYGREC